MTTSLGVEAVASGQKDDEQHYKDNIVFPVDRLKRNRVHKDVKKSGQLSGHIDNSKSAGAKSKWPDFSGITNNQRRESDVV